MTSMFVTQRTRQQFCVPEDDSVCLELVCATLNVSPAALTGRRSGHDAQLRRQLGRCTVRTYQNLQ